MKTSSPRAVAFALALPFAILAAVPDAQATDNGPCGTFDFSSGINCKIEVSGGCTAQCTPLKLEAACSGHCGASVQQTCTDTCGAQCVAQCNPSALDCFAGCHNECDQPTIDMCKQKHPSDDCVTKGKAQCDLHCKDSCAIKPSNCSEHCTKCCHGSCDTQVNFDCDFQCMVDVQGGCTAKCSKPEGGLFCNGQYVNASDIQSCIAYLAQKGISVDVSARGSATCDFTGCKGQGLTTGCSLSPGPAEGSGLLFGLGVVAAGVARGRRRRER